MKKNSPENIAEIVRLRNEERATWRAIAEAMDMSLDYARRLYLQASGDKAQDAPSRFNRDEVREQQILHLRDVEQLTLDEIGGIYGITRERVRQIYKEAGGQHQGMLPRLRYTPRYCKDCGEELPHKSSTSVRCKKCHVIHHTKIYKFWTEERVVEAILKFKERYDRWPVATDFNPGMGDRLGKPEVRKRFEEDGDYPYTNTIRTLFGSWNNAMQAAGRPVEDLWETNCKAFDDPAAMQRTQEFLDAGLSVREIADLEKISVQGVQMRIRILESGATRRSIITGEVKHYMADQVLDGKMTIGEAAREIGTTYSVVQAWVNDQKFKREHPREEAA